MTLTMFIVKMWNEQVNARIDRLCATLIEKPKNELSRS